MTTTAAQLEHLGPDASVDAILELLDRDGGLIVDDVLDAETVEALASDLAPYLDRTADGRDSFSGHRTRRVGALMARSPACRQLALHPLVNEACSRYLAPYSDGYQLHFTQAVGIGPGEGHQPLHRDRGVWGGHLTRAIETQFSTIWAVTDFTAANGATRVVPGSHRWDRDREPEEHEIASAEMAAGSVLLYNGSVSHGGGANRTDARRVGVLLHYTLSWLRQEENQYLSCPPHVAATLPAELRRLMGYSKGGHVLGFYSTPGPAGEGVELASPERLFDPA